MADVSGCHLAAHTVPSSRKEEKPMDDDILTITDDTADVTTMEPGVPC